MKILQFRMDINAPVEKVYSTMIDEASFIEWISVFSPNFSYKGSWEKGKTITYISPDKNGSLNGMISRIEENIPNELIHIQPIGILEDGVEYLEGEKVEGLEEFYEKYTFSSKDGATEVMIETAVYEELEDYFGEMWPRALEKLKAICEG